MAFADPLIAVEDDLMATLRAAIGTARLRVDSLPGDWDAEMLNRLMRMAPCVLVAFAGGGPTEPGPGAEPRIASQWLVYVVTAHPSGEAARRRGDALALGAYEIMSRLVVPVLHNHVVPDIGTLALGTVENLYTGAVEGKGLAVYAVAFGLPLSFPSEIELDELGDFETFAAAYDVPPPADGEQRAAWLVGDDTPLAPDARDLVALPIL